MSYIFMSIFPVFMGCKNEQLGLNFAQKLWECLNVIYLYYLGLEYLQRRNRHEMRKS
jgi:hypothetical protein